MERLTMFFINKNICNASGEVCEQQIKNPKDPNCCCDCEINKKMIDKLAEYEDAEEKGLLLRLPCPIGTTVFVVVEEYEEMYEPDSTYFEIYSESFHPYMLDDIGKYVFLTEEEAEAALKKMQEGKE